MVVDGEFQKIFWRLILQGLKIVGKFLYIIVIDI